MHDTVLQNLIAQECARQSESINLIASENICFPEICKVVGSCLTNKYAEGRPGARYYAGCKIVDEIELLAQERCNYLFGSEYCNVQSHAGTQANFAVYLALLNPGDVILAMDFASGGHLSHGHRLSIVSQLYKIHTYGVDRHSELLDYDVIEKIAKEVRPRLIIAGASSYSRHIDYARMREIADKVGAYLMVDMAHVAGLVAARVHPSPVPYAHVVTATTHKTMRGPRGAFILCKKEFADRIDRAVMPGVQGGPLMHVVAAKAMVFEYATQQFYSDQQKKVVQFAKLFTDQFMKRGMRVVSGGTDTHLLVIDVQKLGINGFDAEVLLEKNGIVVNRNAIPYDTLSPRLGSGVRIGTSCIVAQEYSEKQVIEIADTIADLLLN